MRASTYCLLMVTVLLVEGRRVTGLAIAFLAAYIVLGTLSFMSMFIGSKVLTGPDLSPHARDRHEVP